MKHSILVALVQQLEKKWTSSATAVASVSGRLVRPNSTPGGNIQYFACTTNAAAYGHAHDYVGVADPDLPVVVAVGINYTQGKSSIPGATCIDASLTCRPERDCISHCNAHRPEWVQHGLVSPALRPNVLHDTMSRANVKPFHLVLTNFCPWITTTSWQVNPLHADLLLHPPHVRHVGTAPFSHLDDLHATLSQAEKPELWIGHGLEAVSCVFRLWTERHAIANWMIAGNLGQMRHGCPMLDKGRVVFAKPRN